MHLIWSTSKLSFGGISRNNFPILLHESGKSCVPANEFMRYYLLARGAVGSNKSWASTGRALYDYFSFLEANQLDWRDVDRGEQRTLLAAYRDWALDSVKLQVSTVSQRLIYICKFYEYAKKQSWVERLPYQYELRRLRRAGGFLAHVDATVGQLAIRDIMPRSCKTILKFLTMDQTSKLLEVAENPHHKMMIRFALQTGLRREEIATFPVAYIFDPERTGSSERNLKITLDPFDGHGIKTKGSKIRDIYISRRLMKDLYFYIRHFRGERKTPERPEQPQLFLNQDGQPFAGDGKGIERIVRDIGHKAGIRVHPHMLRHTYATFTLLALQKTRDKNRIEPLAFLQRQLGHASIQSTMVYLHLVNELADNAVLQYDEELQQLVDA